MYLINDRILRSDKKQLLIFWSPKAGCSTAMLMFFEYINYNYDKSLFIHYAREQYEKETTLVEFPTNYYDYISMQVVRNSYARAVSSYLVSRIRLEDYYANFYIENELIYPVKNNLTFIEFLETINYQQQLSQKRIDPHYNIQSMIHSYIPIQLDNIIHLENFLYHIEIINKKYNINLNQYALYDSHSHTKPESEYELIYGEQPLPYSEYYKDSKAKKLVQSIYGIDIDNFKFLYPYK